MRTYHIQAVAHQSMACVMEWVAVCGYDGVDLTQKQTPYKMETHNEEKYQGCTKLEMQLMFLALWFN